MARTVGTPLTVREKSHRNKLVKEYNDLIEKKKQAYEHLMAYEKVLNGRNHNG